MKFLLCIVLLGSILSQTKIDKVQLLNDLKVLSSDDMKGRKPETIEHKNAQNYIIKRINEIGVKSFGKNFLHSFSFKNRRSGKIVNGKNILAMIKGSEFPDSFMVISAHYDHVGIGKPIEGDSIYNGADDNASGTSALFQMMSYYKKHSPKQSIIFAFWDAEEMGLQGAKAFIKNPPIDLSKVKINLNMDMISRSDKSELYICGTYHYPYLKKIISPVVKSAKIKLLFGHDSPDLGHNDWTMQSDQGPFHKAKIPFLYFGVEDHSGYHKPSDSYKNVTKEFYAKSVNEILNISIKLDQSEKIN